MDTTDKRLTLKEKTAHERAVCAGVPEVVVVVVCMRGAVERQGRPARVPWCCQGSRKVDEQPAAHCCRRSNAKGGMPGAAQEYRACVA